MNKGMIFGLGAIVGAAVGAVGSCIVFQKRFQAELDQECEDMKEYYLMRLEELKRASNGLTEASCEDEKEDSEEEIEYEGRKNVSTSNPYEKIVDNPAAGKVNYAKTSVSSKKQAEEENIPRDKAYEIEHEEFDELNEYEKMSITYYISDDTFAQDDDTVIPNLEVFSMIGEDMLHAAVDIGSDIFWVRNEKLSMDIEVVIMKTSYQEYVMGE